jgi:hypothetical protein
MLSIGILFDLLIDFTEVLSGDGGVVATSCLHFLVTASIGTVGEGCRVCAFSELLWFVEGCPSNGFIAIFGHAAIGIIGVGSVLVVGMGF